jgi:hypothetical protein
MAEVTLHLQSLEDDDPWIIEQKTFDIFRLRRNNPLRLDILIRSAPWIAAPRFCAPWSIRSESNPLRSKTDNPRIIQ